MDTNYIPGGVHEKKRFKKNGLSLYNGSFREKTQRHYVQLWANPLDGYTSGWRGISPMIQFGVKTFRGDHIPVPIALLRRSKISWK